MSIAVRAAPHRLPGVPGRRPTLLCRAAPGGALRLQIFSLVAVLGLAACGPGGGKTDAGAADVGPVGPDGTDAGADAGVDGGMVIVPPRPGLACTPTSEALSATTRCRVDSDCPCGAHCGLGVCAWDCLADDQCPAEQACDRFGRCRPADDLQAPSPLAAPERLGRMVVSTEPLILIDAPVLLSVGASGADLDGLKAIAGQGLLVACLGGPDGDAPAAECRFERVSVSEAPRRIEIRRDPAVELPALPTGAASLVRLFAPAQSVEVPVNALPPSAVSNDPPFGSTLPAGRYTGFATPVVTGSVLPEDHAFSRMRIPLEVNAYANQVLELIDRSQAVIPGGRVSTWVAPGGAAPEGVAARFLLRGGPAVLVPASPASDPDALDVTVAPFAADLDAWSSGRVEATVSIPLGPHHAPPGDGVLVWDFEDGTLQGWTAVYNDATNGMGVGTTFSYPSGGRYALEPSNFGLRDDHHDRIVLRSPPFLLDPAHDIVVPIVGGSAAGRNGSGFYPANAEDLALNTDPATGPGQRKMGFAVRRASDGAYIAYGQKSAFGDSDWERVTIPGATLSGYAFEEVTIDIYDAYAGSWGWIAVDSVQAGGELTNPPVVDVPDTFGTEWKLVLTRAGDLPAGSSAPSTPSALQTAYTAGLDGLTGRAPFDRTGPARAAAAAFAAPVGASSATFDTLRTQTTLACTSPTPEFDRVSFWGDYADWLCRRPGGLADQLKAMIEDGLGATTRLHYPGVFFQGSREQGQNGSAWWRDNLVQLICDGVSVDGAGRPDYAPGLGYIPCAGTFATRSANAGPSTECCGTLNNCPQTWDCRAPEGCQSFDFCDEIDAALREAGEPGCLIRDDFEARPMVTTPPGGCRFYQANTIRTSFTYYNLGHQYETIYPQVSVTLTRGCWQPQGASTLLEPAPARCAEGLLCAAQPSSYEGGTFATTVDEGTQELSCSGDASSVAGPLVGLFEAGAPTGRAAIDACVSDLSAPVSGTTFPLTTCISKGRVLAALDFALSGVDGRRAADPAAGRLAHDLMRQLLGVQAFVANELRGQAELEQVLAAAGGSPCQYDFDAQLEDLAASIEAWDVLLHPNQTDAMRTERFVSTLLAPDARPDHVESVPTDLVPAGLPVAMAETLRAQAESLAYFVRRGQLTDAACQVTTDFSAFHDDFAWRASLALGAMRTLAERAAAAAAPGEPAWWAEWENAFARALIAVRGLDAAVEALESDRNPLGIEDEDLPLYFQGNERTAQERFGAISGFMVGVDPLDAALAADYVEGAREALAAARDTWIAQADRSILARRAAGDTARRLEELRRRFGTPIWDACGFSQGSILDVLDWDVDPARCFVDPACEWTPEQQAQHANVGDVAYNLCMASRLRAEYGDGVSTGAPALDAVADRSADFFRRDPGDPQWGLRRRAATGGVDVDLVSRGEVLYTFGLREPAGVGASLVTLRMPNDVAPTSIAVHRAYCGAVQQWMDQRRPTAKPGACSLSDECPLGMLCSSGACIVGTDPLDTAVDTCLRGTLAEMKQSERAARTAAEAARQRMNESVDRYDIAMRSCAILQEGQEAQAAAVEAHNATMQELADWKLAMDVTANAASATKDCASQANGASIGAVFTGGSAIGVACGAAAVEAAAKSVSDGLEYKMDQVQRKHEATMMLIQADTDLRICLNDAELYLAGTRSQSLEAAQAWQEYAVAALELRNAQATVAALHSEGRLALANEGARTVPLLEHDLWLDEKVDRFHRVMRLARRMTYLAVRAVEYEFQYSSVERGNVIAATHPDVLESVLEGLKTQILTGGIGGSRPSQSPPTVVSLRDHILQLGDRTMAPEWSQNMSPTERFRALLTSTRFAVYDEDGEYRGQRIPFTVAPIGAFELGNDNLAPIFSTFSCAERLWSVNIGLPGVSREDGASFTNVILEQRNTFYSQRCSSRGDEDPFQVASVRPRRNLFADPLVNGDAALSLNASTFEYGDQTADFARARIAARAVGRAELEGEGVNMVPGESEELATRALFGDYAIFFPAGELDGYGRPGGLELQTLEDVLIRFSYVSVAN